MVCHLEMMMKKAIAPHFKRIEWLQKTTKNLRQKNLYLDGDPNLQELPISRSI
jgi:hypothetical protein